MKLRSLAAAVAAFGLAAASVASAQTPAAPAPAASTPAPDRNTLSYAIGYDLGRDLAERQVNVDINQVIRALQDGYAKKNPTVPAEQMRTALDQLQRQMVEKARAEFEKVSRENKTKSDAFLTQNRGKQGVQVLPSGIQYRVIENGSGAKPAATAEVQIHFRSSLSTGQEFASTYAGANPQPATFKLNTFPLKGIQEVLKMMPVGSRWEVFLPPDQAYGNDPRSPIGPSQAVVFDLKLVSSK